MGRELQLSPVLLSLCPSTATLGLSEHPGGGAKPLPEHPPPTPMAAGRCSFPLRRSWHLQLQLQTSGCWEELRALPEPGYERCAQGEARRHSALPGCHSWHAPAQVSINPAVLPGVWGCPCRDATPPHLPAALALPLALPCLHLSRRIADPPSSDAVLSAVMATLKSYPFDFRGAKILSGEEEGVFGWITANYLLENFIKVGRGTQRGRRGSQAVLQLTTSHTHRCLLA